ncbi:hypothetical protein [Thiohalomonas denitrificans]|uniref:hypothetical protein n=1 Tax=Thiohalomonas denitrificans TaxID=415747 RepID=UPI0026E93598|nr:hypothetical protein [Thiohalomonas denitrificans]
MSRQIAEVRGTLAVRFASAAIPGQLERATARQPFPTIVTSRLIIRIRCFDLFCFND